VFYVCTLRLESVWETFSPVTGGDRDRVTTV